MLKNRKENMFKCDKCGLCCENLKMSSLYKELDRGDGICKNYDVNTKLCKIYFKRPLICNIDEIYYKYFQDILTLEQYYELNYEACNKLKRGEKNGKR